MSASSLALAPTSPTQGLVRDGSVVVVPTEETTEQDLLAALLTSSQGMACAAALLRNFPSIGHVISAEAAQLSAFGLTGHDVALFRIVREIACRMARAEVRPRPALSNWQALITYLQTAMAYEQIEQFRILFLDRKNNLIADEVQQRGTVNHTPVYPREVMKRALILNASALIAIHNHPSGDPSPSPDDVELTRRLVAGGVLMGVDVVDHIILGDVRYCSLKEMGHL